MKQDDINKKLRNYNIISYRLYYQNYLKYYSKQDKEK